ncbi:MAG TPA: hypothetical protein VIZ63_02180 [Povalibacter sp.]
MSPENAAKYHCVAKDSSDRKSGTGIGAGKPGKTCDSLNDSVLRFPGPALLPVNAPQSPGTANNTTFTTDFGR